MKIAGTSTLHATPEKVWAAITDPAVLAGVIPGCQELSPLGDNHFALTVSMGVAAIRGTYAGEVKLYDMTAPTQLTMRAAGAGGPGTVDTTVGVTLTDLGDGTTRLDYDATATVGGPAGGVGQRVLTSVAKKTAGGFFSAIDDVITGKKPAGAAPAGAAPAGVPVAAEVPAGAAAGAAAPAGAGPAFGATLAPAAAPAAGGPLGAFGPLGAVLIGAAAALIGVLVGARIARRR